MAVTEQPQTAIDERVIEDTELERALEARQAAKDKAGAARKTYSEADVIAKGRIRELELGEAPARCGRFVIAERAVPGRSVAFDTEPTTRVSIRVAKGELF